MADKYFFTVILLSAFCTFGLRALPFLVFHGEKQMPLWLEKLGQILPSAIMAVLIVYCFKDISDLRTGISGNVFSELTAGAVTVAVYRWRHNTFAGIMLGTFSYMALIRII